MLIVSGLLLGLLGSLHCLGMCGPIALALPATERKWNKFLINRLWYNSGRVASYALLGGLIGLLGRGLSLTAGQQTLSIISGVFILLWLLFSLLLRRPSLKLTSLWTLWLKQRFQFLFQTKSSWSTYGIGMLNGLLPCGLVYVALAGALVTGNVWSGITYMVLFGLGTWPMMIMISMGGKWIPPKISLSFNRLLPYLLFTLGIILIVRGLDLGIPYLSPALSQLDASQDSSICH